MNGKNKNYPETKVYYDGSHFIGIPPENFTSGKRKKQPPKATTQDPEKQAFETAYKESQSLPKCERKKYIAERLQSEFETAEQAKAYTEQNLERKKTNAVKRYTRLWRKVRLQRWNYFITFTFDGNKHTEESFRKSLNNTLKHLVSRKGWKYIGVWERGKDTERLHFHGIFVIPENAMIGTLEQITDYDTRKHRKQTTFQNTHFSERFGRNDFKELCPRDIDKSVRYLLKYIEKSGERLVYGGKLPTYIKSNILDRDIICGYGVDEKKVILADDFTCIDGDGVVRGKASSPEVIKQMPKAN